MQITKRPGLFKDLKPGDVFIKGDKLYMRVIVEGKSNAIDLEDGYGTWLSSDIDVAKVAAEIQVNY